MSKPARPLLLVLLIWPSLCACGGNLPLPLVDEPLEISGEQEAPMESSPDEVAPVPAVACRTQTRYEGELSMTLHRLLDAQGREVEHRREYDGDGMVAWARRFFYDLAGKQTGYGTIDLATHHAELTWRWLYEDDLLVGAETIDDEDVATLAHIYTYDELGRRATEEELRVAPHLTTFSYVADTPHIEIIKRDYGPDGDVDESAKYTYDDEGRVDTVLWLTAEGEVATTVRHSYDDAGRLQQQALDTNGDGTANMTHDHLYECPEPPPELPAI